jgi:hypothetical protein
MKRFRLAAWATLVGLGLTSGCSTFGNSSNCGGSSSGFFSRLFHRNNNNCCEVGCPCDMGCGSGFGGCCGPTCDGGGPMVMDPWSGGMPGGMPPGAFPPGAVGGPMPGGMAPQTGVPPLASPPPFTPPVPQAQPSPAGPVSRAK